MAKFRGASRPGRLGCMFLALVLAGCATKRDRYDVASVPLPAKFDKAPVAAELAAEATAKAVAAAAQEKPPAGISVSFPKTALDKVMADWWRLLGSSELDSLVERALANNHDLVIANLRIAQAKARAQQAIADKSPVLSAPAQARVEAPVNGVGTVAPGGQIDSIRTYQASLRVDWRVDLWGEKQALVDSADMLLWRAAFQRDDTQRLLVGSIVASYVEYLSLNDRLRVSRETEEVLSGMVRSVEQRLEKGDATITDLEQQRAAVFQVRATIPALEQRREDVKSLLAQLTGAVPGQLKLTAAGIESLAYPVVYPGIPSALLLRRPDVRVVEARMLSADADIDVARARILPPLDLTGQVGYGSHYLAQMFQPHTFFLNGIANLSATIFDAGRRNREVEFARAVHEEMVETYARVVYLAVREVEDALNALQKTKKRFEAQQEATNSSRRAWEYSQESYSAGAIDYLTLLDTQRTYHRNLDELHVIRMNRYQAMVNLFQSLGGGVEQGDILPGKGWRPTAPDGSDTGSVMAAAPPPIEMDGIDWSEKAFDEKEAVWLVELSGVYERTSVAPKWRDMRKRLAGLLIDRVLLPRRQGRVADDAENSPTWYRLFLSRFASAGEAEKACIAMRNGQFRCRVVPLDSLDPSGAITEPQVVDAGLPGEMPGRADTQNFAMESIVADKALVPVEVEKQGNAKEDEAKPASESQVTGYAVQLGAFATLNNAVKETEALRVRGIAAYVARSEDRRGTWYLVRDGKYAEAVAAQARAAELAALLPGRKVRPQVVEVVLDKEGNPRAALSSAKIAALLGLH